MSEPLPLYSVYDLIVDSDLELPELRIEHDETTADVTIRQATLEPASESDIKPEIQHIDASPGCCRITYESLGTFLIESGERILYDPATPSHKQIKIFRRLLENQAMTVLLLQRGLLVLHASAVSVNNTAVVFLGARTAGKSTMTAALDQHEYPMLADDVVAVRFEDGEPIVVPSVPQIRLSSEAANQVGLQDTISYEEDWGAEKVYKEVVEQSPPVPLGSIYTLEESDSTSIDPIDGTTAFFKLVTNTYAQGLLPDTDETVNHFEQCRTVLHTTPLRQINRPKRYDQLPDVVELVANDASRDTTCSTTVSSTGDM